ncbi:MAG: tripartite tricarboxylate transporter TctB family protein [Deltaproteobacteria bacterium]|nr:tripartite tricarboxylate transporter TctB family protein [Deltaproteobacteria bacterium]MBW1961117.1 tripartite tricarboxylate transporter TctB family protein [Deltaproteobacteria bacterium]MBW1993601.1 tripartite tricarboxylate transporter TctB family protein [Deltaproteobacteria bacterium]MBW2152659.1 tripartite tricarboxylate transporter TctB family protein [Deltaproteobacteria bacterium]
MFAEWIISVLALLMGAVFFIQSFTFPRLASDPGGFSLFPRILSVGIMVASGWLIVKLLRDRKCRPYSPIEFTRKFLRAWRKGADDEPSDVIRRMSYVFVISIVYPWFIVRIGFVLATLLYTGILVRIFRTNILACFILATLVAFGLYLFYVRALEAYVPEGIWIGYLMDVFFE